MGQNKRQESDMDAESLAVMQAELARLQQIIRKETEEKDRLLEELDMLKNRPVQTVTKIESVPPPDYEKNLRELKRLQQERRKLQQIFNFYGISPLTDYIDKYIEQSKYSLKKIAMEFESTKFDRFQIRQLLKLIDYLQQVCDELHSCIAISEQGMTAMNPTYQRVMQDITVIVKTLNCKYKIIDMDMNTLNEFHQLLNAFNSVLKEYIKPHEWGSKNKE